MELSWLANPEDALTRYTLLLDSSGETYIVGTVPIVQASSGVLGLFLLPSEVLVHVSTYLHSPEFEVGLIGWHTQKAVQRTSKVVIVELPLVESTFDALTCVGQSTRWDQSWIGFDNRGGWPVAQDIMAALGSPEIHMWVESLASLEGREEGSLYEPYAAINPESLEFATADDEGEIPPGLAKVGMTRLSQARSAAQAVGGMTAEGKAMMAKDLRRGLCGKAGPSSLSAETDPVMKHMQAQTQLLMSMNARINQLERQSKASSSMGPGLPSVPQSGITTHAMHGWGLPGTYPMGKYPMPGPGMGPPPPQSAGHQHPYQHHHCWPETQFISLEGLETSTTTMARGSAAVQDVVNTVEHNPLAIIAQFEQHAAREAGAFHPWQTWSTTDLTDRAIDKMQGQITLKKCMRMMGHMYELHRRYPANPEYAKAFTAQSLKIMLDVSRSGGSWDLYWPLTGLPDPEEGDQHALSAAERVAVAALVKERKVLQEVAAAARSKKQGKGTAAAPPPGDV